jgi:tetratricopeptide (TPR) repeat protein
MKVQSTGIGCKRRVRKCWRVIWVLPFCLHAGAVEHGPPDPAPNSTVAAARQHLRSAIEAVDGKDAAGAQTLVLSVIDDPVFDSLDEPTRHAALALATQLAVQTEDFEQAHRFALRATRSPEQSAVDWRNRLAASVKIGDARDEAECLTNIARRWGHDSSMMPEATVRQVVRDTAHVDAQVRLDLLQALYELRGRPGEGGQPFGWCLELSRLLLDANRTQEAIQVASIVDDPRSMIALRADRRFRPLLKSDMVRSDPRRAAKDQIEALRKKVRETPRSLEALQRLIEAMLKSRLDGEALALSEEVARRIDAAADGPAPYDDVGGFGFLLNSRSTALMHLGRYDEAVQQLQRGAQLPHKRDLVSQPINLALMLCDLDRPEEALQALPVSEHTSGYGKMLIALAQLTAAVERGVGADADKALSYLREHRKDSPWALQAGLLRAGALDEAEHEFLLRLNDPAERTSMLVEAQDYFDAKLPPRSSEWRNRFNALRDRPEVRAAIAQVGEIDRYSWTYGYE